MTVTKRDIKLYKKYSEQFDHESWRLRSWLKVLPIGQHPPSYERASLKHAFFKRKKIAPIWDRMKTTIIPNTRFKSLWQQFPHSTKDEPPSYLELEQFLKKMRRKK